MDCSQTERLIPKFLDDSLSLKETKQFIKHIEGCKECYEETEVRYMVKYTSIALENDDSISYNLTRLLPRKIRERKKWIRNRERISILIVLGTFLTAAIIAGIILLNRNPAVLQAEQDFFTDLFEHFKNVIP